MTKTFMGFKSRWMTPFECMCIKPLQIYQNIDHKSSSFISVELWHLKYYNKDNQLKKFYIYFRDITKLSIVKNKIKPLGSTFDRFIYVKIFHRYYIWMPLLGCNHEVSVDVGLSYIILLVYYFLFFLRFLLDTQRWLTSCLIFFLIGTRTTIICYNCWWFFVKSCLRSIYDLSHLQFYLFQCIPFLAVMCKVHFSGCPITQFVAYIQSLWVQILLKVWSFFSCFLLTFNIGLRWVEDWIQGSCLDWLTQLFNWLLFF